jgi:uncharacterized membrane protein
MTPNIKTLKIIHLAISLGVILIYFILGDLSMEKLLIQKIETSEIIFFVLPIIAIVLSNYVFKSQLKKADQNLSLDAFIPMYQAASIIRWSILEGAAIFIVISKNNLVLLGIIIIAYLIYLRPTLGKIEREFSNRQEF